MTEIHMEALSTLFATMVLGSSSTLLPGVPCKAVFICNKFRAISSSIWSIDVSEGTIDQLDTTHRALNYLWRRLLLGCLASEKLFRRPHQIDV